MHAIEYLVESKQDEISCVAILRLIIPLRSTSTIKKAIEHFKENTWADSLRAMEITHIHPGKMWRVNDSMEAVPYLDQSEELVKIHNRPTQSLAEVWVQNTSLEITRLSSLIDSNSISGNKVLGYQMPGYEGFDLNNLLDWKFLEFLIREHPDLIPELDESSHRKSV